MSSLNGRVRVVDGVRKIVALLFNKNRLDVLKMEVSPIITSMSDGPLNAATP